MADHVSTAPDRTEVERTTDRTVTVRRRFAAPARTVFDAWTRPELFSRWWLPASFGLTMVSCEMDARTGGSYRLLIRPAGAAEPMAFFGRYLEVVPPTRLSWTNEEGGDGGAITTVTFEEHGGETLVVLRDEYPSKEAFDTAVGDGSTGGFAETFDQLGAFLADGAPTG